MLSNWFFLCVSRVDCSGLSHLCLFSVLTLRVELDFSSYRLRTGEFDPSDLVSITDGIPLNSDSLSPRGLIFLCYSMVLLLGGSSNSVILGRDRRGGDACFRVPVGLGCSLG